MAGWVAHPEPGRQVCWPRRELLQRQREITGLLVMDGAGQRVPEVRGQQAERHPVLEAQPAAAPAVQPDRRLTAARVQPRGDARRVAITAGLGHHGGAGCDRAVSSPFRAASSSVGQLPTAGRRPGRRRWRRPAAAAAVSLAGVPAVGSCAHAGRGRPEGAGDGAVEPAPLMVTETGGDGHPASVAARLDAGGGEAAIWLDRGGRGRLSFQDRVLFSLLSAHLGNALARAIHYEQARDLSLALQQSLLGQHDLAAGFGVRYEPAMRPLEVGGDWYDVTPLDQGRMGVVVGECVGRGLGAAVIMGQLRSACRALLLRNDGPAQALADLDRFAEGLKGAQASTVFCAVIDAAAGTVHLQQRGASSRDPGPPRRYPGAAAGPGHRGPAGRPVPRRAHRGHRRAAPRFRAAVLHRRPGGTSPGAAGAGHPQGRGRPAAECSSSTPDELADRVLVALAPAGGPATTSWSSPTGSRPPRCG